MYKVTQLPEDRVGEDTRKEVLCDLGLLGDLHLCLDLTPGQQLYILERISVAEALFRLAGLCQQHTASLTGKLTC